MPFTLAPQTRRSFLGSSLLAGCGLALSRRSLADEPNPHRFFLLSDTHIAADPKTTRPSGTIAVNMYEHLKQACGEILESGVRPAAVAINGDCAFLTGQAGDYATWLSLLKPLRDAGLPIHATLGNHDVRAELWKALEGEKERGQAPGTVVEDKYVTVIESERADWFILDSLDQTNHTPGVVGAKQLEWLARALDLKPAKPALVMFHHNPDFANAKTTGLTDTVALWDVLAPRKKVKALFFGHTHVWSHVERDGVHLVNLPCVAYPFNPAQPAGWVDCTLNRDGLELVLHALDKAHPKNGEKLTLAWRGM
jgi:3',5'-cyclic AMP phosphodiesterase CpdA